MKLTPGRLSRHRVMSSSQKFFKNGLKLRSFLRKALLQLLKSESNQIDFLLLVFSRFEPLTTPNCNLQRVKGSIYLRIILRI